MGRLSFVIAAGALASVALGCEDSKAQSSAGRSEQVLATGSMATAAPSASAAAAHSAPSAPRTLCDKSPRTLPKSSPTFVNAAGVKNPKARFPLEDKRLLWINFFAAWCGPCKEEIPRLRRFEAQLQKDGVPVDLAFISIDDDTRELLGFFAQQPENGLKASFWLPDGPTRTAWLSTLKMKSSPSLPEHVIVDGKGDAKCFIDGAVEEGDYAQLLASLR
jgi:thiol-disulfide isomerase/thioredoxin